MRSSRDWPSDGSAMLATETLPHVEDMEAGFQIWLRTPHAQLEELRLLLARSGMVMPASLDAAEERAALIEAIQRLSGAGGERELVPPAVRRLAAINLARLTIALLPMTPSEHHHNPAGLRTYVDTDLLRYDVVWAAAGTPRHVFAIAPDDLVRISGAVPASVAT